jgi:hypothetical protein
MSTVIICNGVWVQEIPPAFRQAHIPCEATDLKLQDAVGQQTHAFLSGEVLTAGWQQFSLHHLLEEGDTCVLELITNKTEDLTFMVHIFRVVEVDHSKVQWQDHYMILSRGKCWNNEMHLIKCDKKMEQDSTLAFSEKKNLQDEDATGCLFPGLGSTNALCIAVQKCMVRHNKPQAAKISAVRERLAYRLWSSSSHPQHTAKTNDASSPAKETTTTTTTICDSRVRGTLEELAKVNQAARSSNHFLTRITIPSYSHRIHEQKKKKKKKKKTSSQISKQSREGNNTNRRAAERMVMPLPADDDDDDDDGKGEGIFYRVVRIIKKHFFENEKHYLTELDGPVLQSKEDGVLTEYNGILWWVPERAFSAVFQAAILSRSSLFFVINPRSAIVRRPHLLHQFQTLIRKALAKTGYKIALCTGFSKMEKKCAFYSGRQGRQTTIAETEIGTICSRRILFQSLVVISFL